MTFVFPQLLWLALALVPLAVLARWIRVRREQRLERFVSRDNWPLLNPWVSRPSRMWKGILIFVALAFAVTAAARPQWGSREQILRESGIDMLVAMDVSRSMLAEDVEPNRLEHAKNRLRELLLRFPGHRIGIIPFAGEAIVQCPLTTDYSVALGFLNDLNTGTIGYQGTDIAAAIETARGAFREGGIGARVLLLVTDGESHQGDAIEQARLAAREGIRIYALGIGTEEGSTIRIDGRLLHDREGSPVLTRLDAGLLRELADITGGQAYVSRPGETIDIRPLADDLARLERGEFDEQGVRRTIREERFQWPLGIALALLFVEGFLGDRRRRRGVAA